MLSCTLPKLDKNTNLFDDILLWKQVWMTRAKRLPAILILKKNLFIVKQFKWYRTKDPNANYETGKDVTPMQKGRHIIGMSFSYKRTFFSCWMWP